jgi:hypothetical protein
MVNMDQFQCMGTMPTGVDVYAQQAIVYIHHQLWKQHKITPIQANLNIAIQLNDPLMAIIITVILPHQIQPHILQQLHPQVIPPDVLNILQVIL